MGRPIANTRLYLLDVSPGASACRSPWRCVHWWRGHRKGLPQPAGADGRDDSCRILSAGPLEPDSTGRAIQDVSGRTESSSSSVAPTTRSRSEVSALSPGKLKPPCDNIRQCGRALWLLKRTPPGLDSGRCRCAIRITSAVSDWLRLSCLESVSRRLGHPEVQRKPSGGRNALLELREFLKRKLPEYMVPSAIVELGTLPLTPNGKVDRKALSALLVSCEVEMAQTEPAIDFAAPQTPAEKALATIWQEVLSLNRVGVEDNFFDLGGDSLLAIRMIKRANAGRPADQRQTALPASDNCRTRSGSQSLLTPWRLNGSPVGSDSNRWRPPDRTSN